MNSEIINLFKGIKHQPVQFLSENEIDENLLLKYKDFIDEAKNNEYINDVFFINNCFGELDFVLHFKNDTLDDLSYIHIEFANVLFHHDKKNSDFIEKIINIANENLNNNLLYFFFMNEKILLFLLNKLILNNTLKKKEKLEIFKYAYSTMEYGFENILWNKIEFRDSKSTIKKYLKDWNVSLIDENFIKVYRGIDSESNINGKSWTCDKKYALFFANRYNNDGLILEKTTSIDNIMFIIDNEKEVILYDN